MSLPNYLALAQRYGIDVVFCDLGVYSNCELRSEFDPTEPSIRVNARLTEALSQDDAQRFIQHAIAHELYHYFEHRGVVHRAKARAQREQNAERFARRLSALLR